ncbi:MAG: hypothetical protein EAZ12_01410 [Sphingobacteriia bacterium]|nr:MAG: hypothetical protein EAZ12_01410 [Sphingobacteriia bacterium]
MNKRNPFLQAAATILALAMMVQVSAQTISATAPKAANQRQKSAAIESQQAAQQMKILAEMDAKNAQTIRGNLGALAAMPPMPPMPAMAPLAELAEFPERMEMPELRELAELNGVTYFNGKNFTNVDDLKSKEVSQEISTSKSPDIYIDNSSRGMVVKIWDQPKVKITTTVFYEGDGKLSDEEWLEKLNLSLRMLGSSVKIKSGSIGGGSYTTTSGTYAWSGGSNTNGVAVFNGNGQNIGTKSNIKRVVTVYVPAGSKLDIESKYADVQLTGAFTDANIDLTNGNLDAENINKLQLRSKYSNVTLDNVVTAEIDFINGRFTAKNIDDADIDTKYSTIEMGNVKKIVFRSTNDEYEMEEVGEIRGRKNYGNLRITKLNGSLELDGTNADVKVRNVGPNLSMVKIDNKYADIRLPLRNNKSYSINYVGSYSTVYGNFEKLPLKEEPKPLLKDKEDKLAEEIRSINRSVMRASGAEENNSSRFSALVGDGKALKINMNCQNCTVDFK